MRWNRSRDLCNRAITSEYDRYVFCPPRRKDLSIFFVRSLKTPERLQLSVPRGEGSAKEWKYIPIECCKRRGSAWIQPDDAILLLLAQSLVVLHQPIESQLKTVLCQERSVNLYRRTSCGVFSTRLQAFTLLALNDASATGAAIPLRSRSSKQRVFWSAAYVSSRQHDVAAPVDVPACQHGLAELQLVAEYD